MRRGEPWQVCSLDGAEGLVLPTVLRTACALGSLVSLYTFCNGCTLEQLVQDSANLVAKIIEKLSNEKGTAPDIFRFKDQTRTPSGSRTDVTFHVMRSKV